VSDETQTEVTNQILPTIHHGCGPRVDGSKVRWWAKRKNAEQGARDIGWPLNAVSKIHTRFQVGFALNCGIEGGYLTPERYGDLYHDRNAVRA
jgi:hypothetical protein